MNSASYFGDDFRITWSWTVIDGQNYVNEKFGAEETFRRFGPIKGGETVVKLIAERKAMFKELIEAHDANFNT